MDKCIFCKIIESGNNSSLFWEDNDFVAFLDKYPNTKGQTLVLPKKHYDSDILKLDDSVYGKLLLAAKKVALILENGLPVKRVALVCEGMGINHAHVKLYPLHGLNDEFIAMHGTHRIYFEKYDGYLSTLLGPEASEKDLVNLATQLKNCLTRRSS
jgi:diadenosine tetraphosphate (Ap4A) HIT family hydrolase